MEENHEGNVAIFLEPVAQGETTIEVISKINADKLSKLDWAHKIVQQLDQALK